MAKELFAGRLRKVVPLSGTVPFSTVRLENI